MARGDSQAYADAIMNAINDVGSAEERPSLNSVISALVAVQGHFIGGISDRGLRRSLEKQAVRTLHAAIEQHIRTGNAAMVKTTIRGAH